MSVNSFSTTAAELLSWHEYGVAHGHVTPSNLAISEKDSISILDPGVASAFLRARKGLELEEVKQRYRMDRFAPEVRNGEGAVSNSDIFGLGKTLEDLLRFLEEAKDPDRRRQALSVLRALSRDMCEQDPKRRISLSEVITRLDSADISDELPKAERVGSFSPPLPELSSEVEGQIEKTEKIAESKPELGESFVEEIVPEVKTPKNFADEIFVSPPAAESPKEEESSPLETSFAASIPDEMPTDPVFDTSNPESDIGTEFSAQEEQRFAAEPRESKSWWPVLFFFLLLGAGLWWYRQQDVQIESGPGMSNEQLKAAWYSRRPSLMSEVARRAVDPEKVSPFAELLVVNSGLQGEDLGLDLNNDLLRVAFRKEWEKQLSSNDKRAAIVLAASSLFDENARVSLPPLKSLHPGVLLAIAGNSGENVSRLLKEIPAKVLVQLPAPFGPAFAELTVNEKTSLADPAIVIFSKLATSEASESQLVLRFLNTKQKNSLRALARVASRDEARARRLLNTLLSHPNLKVEDERIFWAKRWKLDSWSEIGAIEKLFLLAGVIPAKASLSAEHLGQMFAHPDARIRAHAMKQAADQIDLGHPGAYEVLLYLSENPVILDSEQTLQLARMLESPDKVSSELIREWLVRSPDLGLVELLIRTSAKNSKETKLDFELGRYLSKQAWEPSLKSLEILSGHPDDLTRMLAYTKLFERRKFADVSKILLNAYTKEKKPDFKKQLQQMLKTFSE